MEYIPWYAWIVLVAIVVAGVVQLVRLTRGDDPDASPEMRSRLVALEDRIERLERR
ncbi:hypothetical protein [Ornithinimicrobium sufpigmenti]|uniref:hypothetical protein n=1 Tax=Ornithinimicrobium sufpigmenti TaxID=2508882 RepID=UPI0015E17A40|nr:MULTISPECIES: hypothetical protein [unclassified Ornithinimicrobium]